MADLIQLQHGMLKFTVLVIMFSYCFILSNAAVYYVKPNESTTCSHTKHECHILSYYLEKIKCRQLFQVKHHNGVSTRNTQCNRSVIIEHVSSLTLVGESDLSKECSAKIECTQGSVGFEFIYVIDLHIVNLTFSECGQAVSGHMIF